jgi:hypothetical protein
MSIINPDHASRDGFLDIRRADARRRSTATIQLIDTYLDFLELAFGERVWPGVTLTLPPIGAGLR